jgi:hypothetical protein
MILVGCRTRPVRKAHAYPAPRPSSSPFGDFGIHTSTTSPARCARALARAGLSPGRGEAGRTVPNGVPCARGVVYERIYAQNSRLCGGTY